ncbi:hypothetical protein BGW38_004854 [Lunasporangiospora selenospora]|uniref:Cytochrome c oxidase assembly factor 3 n=1 Tax=Lunasporangiospora selenospora TaxID=979761 RepID=A0A9P6G0L4_9FUNG|nr:hypothetical protein BGW38_004854 [Lunasporangiospora selenospora]
MLFPKPTSYYESGFRRSAALERASAPYRVRNIVTGAGLVVFCATVYTYSIMAVSQDDFSDIQLPADKQKPAVVVAAGSASSASTSA